MVHYGQRRTSMTGLKPLRQKKYLMNLKTKQMTKRNSAKDWRRAYGTAKAKVTRIETQITERLVELCKANPEIPVATKANLERTVIKAKSIKDLNYIQGMNTEARLAYIEIIEKYLADQHPHQQQKLFK
jgi:hypothetical protein